MNIVMIPFHDSKKWFNEGFRTRDAHVAQHFSMNERVDKILVINRPTSLAEILLKRVSWRTSKCTDAIKPIYKDYNFEICKISEKLYCLDIFVWDFIKVIRERKKWWFSAFQNDFVLRTINWVLNYLNMKDSVLLLQNPMAIGVVKYLNYNVFVFDAIDNWLYHPQMKCVHDIVEQSYKFVDKNADEIFTVSQALKEVFRSNKNVHWIANGVDVEYFSESSRKNQHALKNVGYIGKIQDRVDFDLIEKCLIQYPELKFFFVGPIYAQRNRIRKLRREYPNIEFIGDVHYLDLPKVLEKIDIAIIPHKVDKFTESMNPLKVYEYLAAGKPVVTTGIAGINSISEYVYIGDGDDFVELIESVRTKMMNGQIQSSDVIKSIPDECTWTSRCGEMLDRLDEFIRFSSGD